MSVIRTGGVSDTEDASVAVDAFGNSPPSDSFQAFVADGDKALVFEGETQQEAQEKAFHYAARLLEEPLAMNDRNPTSWDGYLRREGRSQWPAHHEGVDA